METRLQLRRRLLRIDDSKANSSASPEELTALESATSKLRLQAFTRAQQQQANAGDGIDDTEPGESDDDEDADEDDEEGEWEEEDELDTAAASDALNGSTNGTLPPPSKRNDKCETSPVVKLLFSRHDPTRSPTICFDYPPHLNITREYTYQIPSGSSTRISGGAGSGAAAFGQHRVVVLSAQDCPLFYKTHWERNCVKNAFAVAGLMRTKKKWTGWHIAWAKHIPKTKFKFFKNDGQHAQVFNHFPDPWVIGRKDRLMRTLASYKRRFGASYSFVPEGFTLPDQMDAFRRAIQREDNDGSATTSTSSARSIWILKPPASACGRGIRVITSKDVDSISKERKYVVQKYVANPLLLDGFKFDLRIYVVVTSVDPLRIYLFNEGIARFCTSKYSLEKLKNRFSHLTNYSVNKTNDRFVENADDGSTDGQGNAGSKWSLTGLLAHLQSQQFLTDPERLEEQIRDIICKTIIAAEAHLTPLVHQFVKKPVACYELFGFDVMLDSNLKPWLIEVNVSPSLMGGSPLDKRVKGLLLSDIFHLVGVPVSIDSLPAGALPKDLERTSGSHSSSSSSPASSASRKASAPLFSRRRSSGLHTKTAGFRRTTTTPPSLASSSASSSRAAVNKQLHEVVLDPNITHFENNHLELFTSSDWDMVHAMEDEMDRLGHFERIFPSSVRPEETVKYAPLFTCQRYSNALCAKWISSQLSRNSSGSKVRKSKPHQPSQTAKR
ncbi:Tubulin polyglutamylase [Globisporangium polare]